MNDKNHQIETISQATNELKNMEISTLVRISKQVLYQ